MTQIPQWRASNGQTVGMDLDTGDLDVSAGGSFGGALDVGGAITAASVAATGALSSATLTVSGAATLTPLTDRLVLATISVTGGTGGATAGTATVTLTRLDGSAVTSAREVYINSNATAYTIGQYAESVTFASGAAGSVVDSGNGWALVRTNASGVCTFTPSNSDDEVVYFSVITPPGGGSDLQYACVVVGSTSDSAEWTA